MTAVSEAQRRLDFPSLLNARDLGGCPTLDGRQTRPRSLVRADDLAQLSADGLRVLAEFGLETVIDLRWPEEAARYPSPIPRALPHVRYRLLPLLGASEEQWLLHGADTTKELWNCAALGRVQRELRTVLGAIAAAGPGPLVFHCVAGKDRTGLVAALLLALADVLPGAIARDYAASTGCLREGYLRRYAEADPARILAALHCPEEGAHNMLKFLEHAGGVRAYLRDIGLSAAEIGRLRARLRD